MSMEAIGRVPVTDWLLGLVVLVCGVATIVAVWRYADQLGDSLGLAMDNGPDEGDGPGEPKTPLALPPGPSNGVIQPDQIDEELWSIIEAERRRPVERAEPERVERIAARASEPAGGPSRVGEPLPHSGQRHLRPRQDRLPSGPTVFPQAGVHATAHPARPKRRSWASRTSR